MAYAGAGLELPDLVRFHDRVTHEERTDQNYMISDLQPGPETASDDGIQERVLKVIALTKRLPRESVSPDSSFESLGIDSLDRLNILFDLESEFDIQINDEEAKQVETIPQMVAGVRQLVHAGAEEGAAKPVAAPSVRSTSAAAMPTAGTAGEARATAVVAHAAAAGAAKPLDGIASEGDAAAPRDPAAPAH